MEQHQLNEAVAGEGSYEILRARLAEQGKALAEDAGSFNQARQQAFGARAQELLGRVNVHTEHRCLPIDIAQINGLLLFGYRVQVGLKAVPSVEEVLGLYRLVEHDGQFRVEELPLADTFLDDARFRHSFNELFTYYKDTRLIQISRRGSWLYLVFQIGSRLEDRKVYRWQLHADGRVEYLDDPGQAQLDEAPQQDVQWQLAGRDHQVQGDRPHLMILDQLFVDCLAGSLSVRIENNTPEGLEIFNEPVEDVHQTLADTEVHYAEAAGFILLKVRPNREKDYRYLAYNRLTEKVVRADAIGASCKLLPEDHGLLFANGYLLADGDARLFDEDWRQMRYFHREQAPNGEDVLFIFFDPVQGAYLHYSYNLIEKSVSPPNYNHGYSLYNDGRMLMFRLTDNSVASKLHPLRIWQTPFMTLEIYEADQHQHQHPFFANIGNAELVRGIAEINSIVSYCRTQEVTRSLYEILVTFCGRTLDNYHWLDDDAAGKLGAQVREITTTAEQIVDEFAKVQLLRQQTDSAIAELAQEQRTLLGRIKLSPDDDAAQLIQLLAGIKTQLGRVISLKGGRYVDEARLSELEQQLEHGREQLNQRLLRLLQKEQAYQPFLKVIDELERALPECTTTVELDRLREQADEIHQSLDLINEEVAEIETQDATQATRILDLTTEVVARLNACLARLRQRHQQLRQGEAEAEFEAQLKLLTQAVTSALGQADSPESCDEQQARLMGMIEKLESRFAEFDQFLADIYHKRDEIQSSLESRKQQLLAARQKRLDNLAQAAEITLTSIDKRVRRFDQLAELNGYFAADAMVHKLAQLATQMEQLGGSVRAEAVRGRVKTLKEQAMSTLRDNQDIFEQGGSVLKLGRHRFAVNTQEPALTLVHRQQQLALHLTGTDFYEPVVDAELETLSRFGELTLPSESPQLSRSEYLAYCLLQQVERRQEDLSPEVLEAALKEGTLTGLVQRFAASRYRDGYVKGIHDQDAVCLLTALWPLYREAGLLRFGQRARATGLLWLSAQPQAQREHWRRRGQDALQLQQHLGQSSLYEQLQQQLALSIQALGLVAEAIDTRQTADYLLRQLATDGDILISRDADELAMDYLSFRRSLDWQGDGTISAESCAEHQLWLQAFCEQQQRPDSFVVEAAALACLKEHCELALRPLDFSLAVRVQGLLADHPRLDGGELILSLDDFLTRGEHHQQQVLPAFDAFQARRSTLLEQARDELRPEQFQARPLSGFVRNKLISESYLGLIGDNFAKQLGAMGTARRTDQMGLLMLISPPGYGKTTLVEYIAGKLGMVFMKINCPSLGHEVVSLDPADAPNATAAREIEKLNLGLEMGSNVLLYLDDIQHTHPEFLQKFISLSDGTRRIDGVWRGQPKTYDMKGKRFALVMAGNPYTESGEVFRLPDMLANRADIYNLGDMLSDQRAAFELSYVENALSSSPVLAPLASRNLKDLYLLVAMARGEDIALSELEHNYSAHEAREITGVLSRLLQVQQVVLKVNQQYIASAASADDYRTEPPFKLQGSYRNMNKLAEKVMAVMTEQELERLLDDHYLGEAQTLTQGTEENLLKLAELRGTLTPEQAERWAAICARYRQQHQPVDKVGVIADEMKGIGSHLRTLAWSMMQSSNDEAALAGAADKEHIE